MGSPVVDSAFQIVSHVNYTNSINGLIILISVTLAFIEFVYSGHSRLIEEVRNHIRNMDYPPGENADIQDFKKQRDDFLNGYDAQLKDFSPKVFVYILICLLLLCAIIHILTLFFPQSSWLMYILAVFFALLPIKYILLLIWLTKVEEQRKYIQQFKKEHVDIIKGFELSGNSGKNKEGIKPDIKAKD